MSTKWPDLCCYITTRVATLYFKRFTFFKAKPKDLTDLVFPFLKKHHVFKTIDYTHHSSATREQKHINERKRHLIRCWRCVGHDALVKTINRSKTLGETDLH